ncbi:MAG: AAA family ATPase, partial [Candidatus Heimdallarchaeota archaeon]|nr:AAA family ATPase [Candidatus Heimdallarchaeota archaeon]
MNKLLLTPVGYPLRGDEPAPPHLTTDDPSLFEHYAQSQWAGLVVKKGTFLFDSLLFPDYAFRAVNVEPDESQITKKTRIQLYTKRNIEPKTLIRNEQVRYTDIIGQDSAKEKCRVIGKFLNSKELMRSPWAPKNILFWGPPGNGKTMMAKALSHEIKKSMFLIKASDLLGVYVGDGARKIHSLYEEAREESPAIIFIDEFDSIALKRNFQSIRGDVVELVSALLGEMDGIEKNQGIITIGSTNKPESLDSAILSRFEELIEFKLPSSSERKIILDLYAKSSPIPFINIHWNEIVQKTDQWSGRDLKDKIIK